MISGYFGLQTVHQYLALASDLPRRMDRPEYRAVCNLLTAEVPDIPGWYVWLDIGEGGPNFIYVGQSRKAPNASLRLRISEELADERSAFLVKVHGEQIIPELKADYGGRYGRETDRSVLKKDTTHIAWVGQDGLTQGELDDVECALIERFKPTANHNRRPSQHMFDNLASSAEKALLEAISRIPRQEA